MRIKGKIYNSYCAQCGLDTQAMHNSVKSLIYKSKFCDIKCWNDYQTKKKEESEKNA